MKLTWSNPLDIENEKIDDERLKQSVKVINELIETIFMDKNVDYWIKYAKFIDHKLDNQTFLDSLSKENWEFRYIYCLEQILMHERGVSELNECYGRTNEEKMKNLNKLIHEEIMKKPYHCTRDEYGDIIKDCPCRHCAWSKFIMPNET